MGAVEKFTASLKEFTKHVGATYRHGADLQSEIRKMSPFDLSKLIPEEPKLFDDKGVETKDKKLGTTT